MRRIYVFLIVVVLIFDAFYFSYNAGNTINYYFQTKENDWKTYKLKGFTITCPFPIKEVPTSRYMNFTENEAPVLKTYYGLNDNIDVHVECAELTDSYLNLHSMALEAIPPVFIMKDSVFFQNTTINGNEALIVIDKRIFDKKVSIHKIWS